MGENSTPAFMPFIPGMRSTHYEQMAKSNFRRGQLLERMSMGKLTSAEKMPSAPASAFQAVVSAATAAKAQELRPTSTVQASYTAPPQPDVSRLQLPSSKYRVDSSQPAWITHDRLVLRFFAYFIEPVELADGRTEKRVRRVVVCFYLSDRSISISEPRVANSGISQGEFMRRAVVRKTGNRNLSFPRENISNDFYSPDDFRIGGELRLYGRTFHLVDCDAATRSFYAEALGDTLETPRMYPDEASSKMDEVDELKDQLRLRTRVIGASKAEATRKFHDLSQKVLRFYASWHDDHPLYPETRHFILHYYLCDDTVEIIEARDRNRERGRGHFGVLLSRRKLARETGRQQNDDDGASYFITDRDLRCGEWITAFSRRLLLENCDAFTREYYLETHGVTQEKFEPTPPEAPETAPKWRPFHAAHEPQTPSVSHGRGTSGYSANNNNGCMQGGLVAPIPGGQSCGRSSVTPLCRDDDLDGKQLRFRARFQDLPRGDMHAERDFVLTYFLEDETLAVFEPRVRNSGVLGGRFLDRGRYRKDPKLSQSSMTRDAAVPIHYQASDIYVGAVLTFEFSPHQRLELVEADSQTLSFCESHPEVFRYSDSSAVLALTAKLWMNRPRRVDLRREWRQLDSNQSHFVSSEAMKNVLSRAGLTSDMNEQQIITLYRRFKIDTESDNNQSQEPLFGYDDFCDILSALVARPPSHEERGDSARTMSWKLMKIPRVRKLLSYAGSNYYLSSLSDLLRVMEDQSVTLSKPEVDVLTSRFAASNGRIDIHRLCDYVFQLSSDQPQASDSKDIDFSLNFDSGGDEALPPASTRSTARSTSKPDSAYNPQSVGTSFQNQETLQPLADPHVIRLLQRGFGARKYQLRKALRDRDVEKNGRLREDEFMDALQSVAPQLSDDDSYLLADAFFPTNNSYVDYPLLLDSAFRN
ncbi:EF-hand domain-containing member C2 [Phytophthora pseudosyringae]|uniref:EF-hand domain-containing member C2 n=1 Tax=Phytophthora pseudosyringae TaxID=221518 RepID=A0A8T1WFF6_9STRA|nr:EF-hand domain-containing member C2 [Phytophthora pseudosyringae]